MLEEFDETARFDGLTVEQTAPFVALKVALDDGRG